MATTTTQPLLPSLELVLDSITDSFSVVDREWRLVYLNPVAKALLGRANISNSLLGKNLWEEFPEEVGSESYRAYHRAMNEQTKVTFESHYAPLDLHFRTNVYPFENGIAILSQDVTELVRAQRDATLQAERLRLAVDSTHVGLWDYNPQNGELVWNDECKKMFGVPVERDIDYATYISMVHPED